MREAVVEAKLAVGETREAVARTERALTQERQRLADAERRGRLASEIQDRETVEVAQRLRAEHDRPLTEAERSAERAWRDLQAAGGPRPGVDAEDQLLKSQLDRAAREAAADRQLRELKKKMKKD